MYWEKEKCNPTDYYQRYKYTTYIKQKYGQRNRVTLKILIESVFCQHLELQNYEMDDVKS